MGPFKIVSCAKKARRLPWTTRDYAACGGSGNKPQSKSPDDRVPLHPHNPSLSLAFSGASETLTFLRSTDCREAGTPFFQGQQTASQPHGYDHRGTEIPTTRTVVRPQTLVQDMGS